MNNARFLLLPWVRSRNLASWVLSRCARRLPPEWQHRYGYQPLLAFAVLAVAGNVAVSWSWFGTNELGVGLHSYGFTDGVLLALGLFVLSQLAVIAAGCLPRSLWVSFRGDSAAA